MSIFGTVCEIFGAVLCISQLLPWPQAWGISGDFAFSSAVTCYKKASEYDQEIPQSHTADQPTAP